VTVVSPLYNGERHARSCIECVLAQTWKNWRYVIVDNHSSDATNAIAMAYAAQDERIRVVRNPETFGVIRNHNEGFRQVEPGSAYFRFLQADDVLRPDCLEAGVALAEAHPSVGIVGSWLQWGDRVTANELPAAVNVFPGRETARRVLLGETYPFLSPSGLLFRMTAVQAREPFFDESYLYADVQACYEILRHWDFGLVDRVLTEVGKDEASVTNKVTRSFNKLLASNLHLFVAYGPEYLSEAEYAKALAERLDTYYTFLGRSRFERREPAFWAFHRDAFGRCSLTLDDRRVRDASRRLLKDRPIAMLRVWARSFHSGKG